MFRLRRTDCGTGWQVVASNGSLYATTRRYEAAAKLVANLNGTKKGSPDGIGYASDVQAARDGYNPAR